MALTLKLALLPIGDKVLVEALRAISSDATEVAEPTLHWRCFENESNHVALSQIGKAKAFVDLLEANGEALLSCELVFKAQPQNLHTSIAARRNPDGTIEADVSLSDQWNEFSERKAALLMSIRRTFSPFLRSKALASAQPELADFYASGVNPAPT